MSKEQRVIHESFKSKQKQVEASELNARHFKAEFETMYYALKIEEIRPSYMELLHTKYPEAVTKQETITGSTEENPFETSIEEQLVYADTKE